MGKHGHSPADSAGEQHRSANPYGGNPYGESPYGDGHYSDSLPERRSRADDGYSTTGHLDADARRVPDSLPGLPDFRDNPASHQPLEDAAGPGRPRRPIGSGIGTGFGMLFIATAFGDTAVVTSVGMVALGLSFIVVFGWPMWCQLRDRRNYDNWVNDELRRRHLEQGLSPSDILIAADMPARQRPRPVDRKWIIVIPVFLVLLGISFALLGQTPTP